MSERTPAVEPDGIDPDSAAPAALELPADLEVPVDLDVPVTGDPGVDAAIDRVAAAAHADLEEQASAYEGAHRLLTDRLADVEG